MSGLRPALRIARRSVLRSRGRSLLIALLIAVPVAGGTFADVIGRTFSAPALEAQRAVGTADAAVTVTWSERLVGGSNPRWLVEPTSGRVERDPDVIDVSEMLPAGSRVVGMPRYQPTALKAGERTVSTTAIVADVKEPLHRFAAVLEGGSAPRSGEVLITRKLAEQLGLDDGEGVRAGASVTLLDGTNARVSGLVRDPSCLPCARLVAPVGSPVARATAANSIYGSNHATEFPSYLVDLPASTSHEALGRDLAARGIALTTRDALAHPERYASSDAGVVDGDALRTMAQTVVIVGLGVLMVVLLAGTAFAVGTRRQVRELGLVAAGGGSDRDIRRIVLAQGLVLGAAGAAIGAAGGLAIAIGGRPLWERIVQEEIAGWVFRPWEIAGIALVGMLAGLAAAVVPAIGAGRMPAVNALAGRFRSAPRAGRRGARIGVALVATGAVCGLLGQRGLADDFAAYERALAQVERTGLYLDAPSAAGPLALILGGATLAVIGLVLLAPALIGAIARVGSRLPLSARLAVRDAERHRHRTGPATSAIVVAVTGSIVLAFALAGTFRANELRHPPPLPPNTISVERGEGGESALLRGANQAAGELPQARINTLAIPLGAIRPGHKLAPHVPVEVARRLYVDQQPGGCPAGFRSQDCGFFVESGSRNGAVAIGGDDATTRLVAGPGFDAAARRALDDGKALVFAPRLIDREGKVRIGMVLGSRGNGADETIDEARMPAHLVEGARAYEMLPAALVSERAAQARGLEIRVDSVLVSYDESATRDDVDAAIGAAGRAGTLAIRDRPDEIPEGLVLALIAGAAGLITLIGVAISVALSAAEGRADLATMAAVGAPPRRRRALMAGQALLVGGLGSLLGVGLGTFIAFTSRATTGSPDFVVPWANVAATGIGVPLLAAFVAALCTGGRLPLVRRAE